MHRLIALGALVVLAAAAHLRGVEMQVGTVHQLAPGVWMRQGDKDIRQPANTGWIEFKDFVVVIDANTPWGIQAALPEIKKTTAKPIRYAFDTHYHWDHTQGNSLLVDQGVTVICSQGCADELKTKGQGEWTSMSRNQQYNLAPYRLQAPSITFGELMAIDDGARRLEMRRVGPAHTIGDAVGYLPAEAIVFTGDLVVNWKFGNNVGDRDADVPHWSDVLLDIAQWNVKTVVPGHGAIGDVETLRRQSAFLKDLWAKVSAGKKAGKTLDELLKEIDLSSHGDWAADAQQNQAAIRQTFRRLP
ncbi:MAG: MBL fold metallo-hydrolase [Acidobacteria bacterium]|nr:MBL fold metallo-hydrolase [Acidobacteriota bacterium]